MVDTTDLKSVPVRECEFESRQGHHYSMEAARDALEMWDLFVSREKGASRQAFLQEWAQS